VIDIELQTRYASTGGVNRHNVLLCDTLLNQICHPLSRDKKSDQKRARRFKQQAAAKGGHCYHLSSCLCSVCDGCSLFLCFKRSLIQ
jgi:hypothetical protein